MPAQTVAQENELVIVAYPRAHPGPHRTMVCRVIEYADGRWCIDADGREPIRGDRHEGGREAVARLLGWLAAG